MSYIIDGEGYDITELDTSHLVLQTVKELKPSLILLDVMLGDMDGRDICRALKSDSLTKSIPVIMVSASHEIYNKLEQLCYANEYLDKPFNLVDLISHVEKYVA